MKKLFRRASLFLAAVGIAAPAWAESAATRKIDDAIGGCEADDDCERVVDIDFGGLTLRDTSLHLKGHRLRAERIRVEPRLDGLHVLAAGLDIQREPSATPKVDTVSADHGQTPPASSRLAGLQRRLAGIPVHVKTRGRIRVDGPRNLALEVRDPGLELAASGETTVRFSAALTDDGEELVRLEEVVANAATLSADTWNLEARIAGRSGPTVRLEGEVSRAEGQFGLVSGAGHAQVRAEWKNSPRLDVQAENFSLGFVDTDAFVDERARINLAQATLNGSVRLTKTEDSVSVDSQGIDLSGMVVDAPMLSKDPLYMQPVAFSGAAHLRRETFDGEFSLSHGHIEVETSAHVGRDDLAVELRLAPLPCQALLESMPAGFMPMLEGMQMRGEVDALAKVEFAFAKLEQLRKAPAEAVTEADAEAPGEISVEFPFLEQCAVVRDAPGIDLDALEGSYRHRFLTASGRERSQILAPGAQGFITVAGAPDVARAFVIREDAGFWRHDGFDRVQIERAFWHNLGVAGFSRGASTITQQTARNLWLGHERSLGRKLQEAVLTSRLEDTLDKRRILEIYMNIIELGPEVHGVADAARYHFDRSAHELNVLQSLHLAALAPAPVTYSARFDDGEAPGAWKAELRTQVRRLAAHHMISSERATAALRQSLSLRSRAGD